MYQGIEISEVSLIMLCIGFTLFVLVLLSLSVFLLATLRRGNSKIIPLKIVAAVLSIVFALGTLFICLIPGWSDYIKKDYVVYEGSYEVTGVGGDMKIILEDGTSLKEQSGLDEGEFEGRVVYSKRTKIPLGMSKSTE